MNANAIFFKRNQIGPPKTFWWNVYSGQRARYSWGKRKKEKKMDTHTVTDKRSICISKFIFYKLFIHGTWLLLLRYQNESPILRKKKKEKIMQT